MRTLAIIIVSAALAACASQQDGATSSAGPSACYERSFNVYFEDTTLSPEAAEAIEAVETSLRGCTINEVRVVGFAERGEPDEPLEVSQARADAVADYLRSTTDWPRSAYLLVARGDSRSVNDEGEARPMRRRARVIVNAAPPAP